ncbi:hypothetical protein BCV69DRAFT_178473 [Microstroma glucosiphilum]|uniref:Uncharacterized protein n=1 Tax=Pseudomicrostroma glucosiphilum TaxID=1684307 RepID=A0A316U6R4_9BASI|nr:hypothetical protein BCV69DRAFT_178473 [Pseudomicrostroma glucosiphilum]PWN20910.1 hypothetical protein BCV69DRAFT_178473 [Pseudomicrostroma glucosiphilum]
MDPICGSVLQIMDKMQGRRTKGDWPELMYALRKTILSAREKLSKTLERQYDRKVSLAAFEEAYNAWENKLTAEQLLEIKDAKDHYEAARVDKLQLKRFFLAFFDGKGLLDNNRIHKIERKCFKACIKLLKEAAEKMKEKEEQSTRRAAKKSENLEGAAEVSGEEGEDEDESPAERSQSGTDENE